MRGIAVALIATLGCASETGVMLVITTADNAPAPDELVVFVGAPADGSDAALEFSDPEADRFALETGRDLAAEPFRYLVRPGESNSIRVAAVGLGEQLQAPLTAHYADTLEFAPEVVLEVELKLEQSGTDDFDDCSLCFRSEGFEISSPFDADCDESRPAEVDAAECEANPAEPPDCDDHDAGVNARQIETCDGTDNDCDQVEQVSAACFIDELDTCRIGTQVCTDGEWATCMGEGDPDAAPELCTTFGDCALSEDPVDCLIDRAGADVTELDCEVQIAPEADNNLNLCSSGLLMNLPTVCEEFTVLAVEGPPDAAEVVRIGAAGAFVGTSVACGEPTELTLGASRQLTRGARFVFLARGLDAEASVLHVINLLPKYVEACAADEVAVSCVTR